MSSGGARKLYRGLLATLAEGLRPHGFRRHGGNFRREFPHVAQVVGVQKSDASTPDWMRFTLNVGVWSRDVDLARGREGRAPGSTLRCHAVDRVGGCTSLGRDAWWRVDSPESLATATFVVQRLLDGGVLPHLDRLTTAEALLAEWTKDGPGLRPDFDRERFVGFLRGAVAARSGEFP